MMVITTAQPSQTCVMIPRDLWTESTEIYGTTLTELPFNGQNGLFDSWGLFTPSLGKQSLFFLRVIVHSNATIFSHVAHSRFDNPE